MMNNDLEKFTQVETMILDAWKVFEGMKTNDPDKLMKFYNDNVDLIFSVGFSCIGYMYLCSFNKEWHNYYIDLLGIEAEKFDIKSEMIIWKREDKKA